MNLTRTHRSQVIARGADGVVVNDGWVAEHDPTSDALALRHEDVPDVVVWATPYFEGSPGIPVCVGYEHDGSFHSVGGVELGFEYRAGADPLTEVDRWKRALRLSWDVRVLPLIRDAREALSKLASPAAPVYYVRRTDFTGGYPVQRVSLRKAAVAAPKYGPHTLIERRTEEGDRHPVVAKVVRRKVYTGKKAHKASDGTEGYVDALIVVPARDATDAERHQLRRWEFTGS